VNYVVLSSTRFTSFQTVNLPARTSGSPSFRHFLVRTAADHEILFVSGSQGEESCIVFQVASVNLFEATFPISPYLKSRQDVVMEKVFSHNLEYNSAPAGPCMAASRWDYGPLSRINLVRRPVPRSPLFLLAPCPQRFKPAKNAMLERNYRKPPQLLAAKSPHFLAASVGLAVSRICITCRPINGAAGELP